MDLRTPEAARQQPEQLFMGEADFEEIQ